jgi:hypothetical protein
MSVQILLQGKILGTEEFLLAGAPEEPLFAGRLRWVSLLSEVLPRALIAELGLSKMLLGSSGGEQFLAVLPEEVRARAEEFLNAASADINRLSQGRLRLLWAITENLGDWTVVRKRLNEEFDTKQNTPLAATGLSAATEDTDPGLWREAESIPGALERRRIPFPYRATRRSPTMAIIPPPRLCWLRAPRVVRCGGFCGEMWIASVSGSGDCRA